MKQRKNILTALILALCLALMSCNMVLIDDNNPETFPDGMEENRRQQILSYLSGIFDKAYQLYYEGLDYEISDYKEEIAGNEFSSEFLFTMWHLDSGADIGSEMGKKTKANFGLKVNGIYSDGNVEIDSVMFDVSPTGQPDYSLPVEECFPDENASVSLVGYVREINEAERKLVFDKLFFLTSLDNEELLNQLGVSADYLPNGYYLYNPEESYFEYEISQDVVCHKLETVEGHLELLKTTLSAMAEALNTYTPLYDITVKNGVVEAISERYIP